MNRTRPIAANANASRESGVALVAVLWTVVLLSALAAALVATSRSNARLVTAERERLQASEAAQAGIDLALTALSDQNSRWNAGQISQSFQFAGAAVDVTISAEDGKIDLNRADPKLISGILGVAGAAPGAAQAMANAIVARRTTGDGQKPGADATDDPSRPAPFNSLGELMEIPGMTADLYDRVAPSLTLYSGSRTVVPALASSDVLLAIPGNTRADAEAAVRLRSFSGGEGKADDDLARTLGHAFTLVAIARFPDGTAVQRRQTVRLTANPKEPVWVLAN